MKNLSEKIVILCFLELIFYQVPIYATVDDNNSCETADVIQSGQEKWPDLNLEDDPDDLFKIQIIKDGTITIWVRNDFYSSPDLQLILTEVNSCPMPIYHAWDIPKGNDHSFPDIPVSPGWYYLTFSHVGTQTGNCSFKFSVTFYGINHDPDLTEGSVDPSSGTTLDTYTFQVKYTDTDGDQASSKELHILIDEDEISGSPFNMNHLSGDPNSGEWFSKELSDFIAGIYNYYFYFTDGNGGSDREPESGEYSFTVTQANVAPSISITQPDGVDDIAHLSYTIEWTANDDNDASISLYYDTDGSGNDGTFIVSGLSEDNDDSYTWDENSTIPITNVPSGSYYIYGVIDDEVNDLVTDYSSDALTLDHDPPTWSNGEGIQNVIILNENSVKLFWNEATDNVIPPVNYNIYYQPIYYPDPGDIVEITNISGNISIETEYDLEYTVNNLVEGQLYYFWIKAEDNLGNETTNIGFLSCIPTPVVNISDVADAVANGDESYIDQRVAINFLPISTMESPGEQIEDVSTIYTWSSVLYHAYAGCLAIPGPWGCIIGGIYGSVKAYFIPDEIGTLLYFFENIPPLNEKTQIIVGLSGSSLPIYMKFQEESPFENGYPYQTIGCFRSNSEIYNDGNLYYFEFDGTFNTQYPIPLDLNNYPFVSINELHEADGNIYVGNNISTMGMVVKRGPGFLDNPAFFSLFQVKNAYLPNDCVWNIIDIYMPDEYGNQSPTLNSIVYASGEITNFFVDTYTMESNKIHLAPESGEITNTSAYDCIKFQSMEIVLNSPADIHLYNSNGEHVGLIYDSDNNIIGYENQIEGTIYTGDWEPEVLICLNPDFNDYTLNIVGTENGTYDQYISIYDSTGTAVFEDSSISVPIDSGQTHENIIQIDTTGGKFDITLGDTTPPSIPSDIQATEGLLQLSLNWNFVPEADLLCYAIFTDIMSGFVPSDSSYIGSSDTTFFITDSLQGGTTYFFRISAIDSAGNQSNFSEEISATPLEVQYFNLSGDFTYYSDQSPSIENVSVYLTGDDIDTVFTDHTGSYELSNIIGYQNYKIKPYINSITWQNQAITPFDKALILRHYVQLDTLDELQLLAADVSGNGSVLPYDGALILQYYVGLIDTFSVNDWLFIPDSIVIESLDKPQTDLSFTGILAGDVSGNWDGSQALEKNLVQNIPPITYSCSFYDDILELYISLGEISDIIGIGLSLEYPAETFELISIVNSEGNKDIPIEYSISNNALIVGFAKAIPFQSESIILELKFKLGDNIKLNNDDEIAFILKDVLLNENLYTQLLSIETTINQIPTDFVLFQNYPNPFNASTVISYQIPIESNVKLIVYNIKGQEVVKLVDVQQMPGYYSVNWNSSQLSSGLYFFQLKADDFTEIKKCLVIK